VNKSKNLKETRRISAITNLFEESLGISSLHSRKGGSFCKNSTKAKGNPEKMKLEDEEGFKRKEGGMETPISPNGEKRARTINHFVTNLGPTNTVACWRAAVNFQLYPASHYFATKRCLHRERGSPTTQTMRSQLLRLTLLSLVLTYNFPS
jgi:hypothetical protein